MMFLFGLHPDRRPDGSAKAEDELRVPIRPSHGDTKFIAGEKPLQISTVVPCQQ
jgi:hypothetical protein